MVRALIAFALAVIWTFGSAAVAQSTGNAAAVAPPANFGDALRWYRKAAEAGSPKAQYLLGHMLEVGRGQPRDPESSARWYRRAAAQGHVLAQFRLGWMHGTGDGIPKDVTEAVKWYRMAAEQGDATAQFNLALMCSKGDGTSKDAAEALKWYRLAADQGYASAQFNLAVMYGKGEGVLTSGGAAADWYYRAGLSYLKEDSREDALTCVDRIKYLESVFNLTVPNSFLADRLLEAIYREDESTTPSIYDAQSEASPASMGTGWTQTQGYVVTCYHVVEGRSEITLLRHDGVRIPASVAIADSANDLVLLKVEDQSLLPPAIPLASKPARVGAPVLTIGFPLPDIIGSRPKVTSGTVSGDRGVGGDPRACQITVPIQAGNSGGPLLNFNGEVVGIVTSKLNAMKVFQWTGDLPDSVNFAVKTAYLSALLSSAPEGPAVPTLESSPGTLEELSSRISASVLIVIAK